MTPEKKITINGQEVFMIYCAATENGFEIASGNKIGVFAPTFDTDENGNTYIKEQAQATIGDFLALALAGIVAYYSRKKMETPIDSDYILYEATPQERNDLITSIIELRNDWYFVPKVVDEMLKKEASDDPTDEPEKNA